MTAPGSGNGARRPGARPVLISLGAHLAILVPLIAFARPPVPIEMHAIRVHLVAAPPAAVADPEPAQAASPPAPQPEPEPQVVPEPEAAETPRPEPTPRPPEQRVERPPVETPPAEPEPERQPPARRTQTDADPAATGGDNLNINTEGREFPYPDYLANVLEQVNRYFRWSDQSRPVGIVYFEILRDGSVRGIRMFRSSGNIRFDFAVQGAVETAGNRGAFGPLPDGFAAAVLPVTIEVEPPR